MHTSCYNCKLYFAADDGKFVNSIFASEGEKFKNRIFAAEGGKFINRIFRAISKDGPKFLNMIFSGPSQTEAIPPSWLHRGGCPGFSEAAIFSKNGH